MSAWSIKYQIEGNNLQPFPDDAKAFNIDLCTFMPIRLGLNQEMLNFAHIFINNGKVKKSYINQTQKLAEEYRTKIKSGGLEADEAVKQVL